MDGHYRSDGEPDDASRHQDGGTADNGGTSNLQLSGKRTAMAGKWWKLLFEELKKLINVCIRRFICSLQQQIEWNILWKPW